MMTYADGMQIKEKALSMGLDSSSRTVAVVMGKKQPKKHGTMHVFENDKIKIEYDDYGDNLSVNWKLGVNFGEKLITHTGDLIKAIIGYNWTHELTVLYTQAQGILEQKEQEKQTEESGELSKFWQDTTRKSKDTKTQKSHRPNDLTQAEFDRVVNYVRDAVWTKEDKND